MKENAEEIFRHHGGRLRMSEATALGMTRSALYALKDRGVIERVSRGIYRLAELPPIRNPDMVTVSLRFPNAVICLVSALAHHEMTTQIPHEVSVAVPRNAYIPFLDYPPLQVYTFSRASYQSGIEEHLLDGVPVKIYSAAKTMADCFKFRNKVGMDVVLEALKLYRKRKRFDPGELARYARICRVENVMRPYLEAIT